MFGSRQVRLCQVTFLKHDYAFIRPMVIGRIALPPCIGWFSRYTYQWLYQCKTLAEHFLLIYRLLYQS